MAINFPSTSGQATDGSFTHTENGVTWSWDGTTWKATGIGAAETDPVYSASAAANVTSTKITEWDTAYGWGNHASAGYLTSYTETDTLATVTARGATTNDTVVFGDASNGGEFRLSLQNNNYLKVFGSSNETYIRNQDNDIGATATGINIQGRNGVALYQGTGNIGVWCDSSGSGRLLYQSATKVQATTTGATITGSLTAGGLTYPTTNGNSGEVLTSDGAGNVSWQAGGGVGLQSRTTAQGTTASVADGVATYLTITAAPTYALHKIQTDGAAWVTIYTDTTSRTNDASRSEATDPVPGSGVIAEVITTGAETQIISPGTVGWSEAGGDVTSDVYLKVVNKTGLTQTVTVTLHYVPLEA